MLDGGSELVEDIVTVDNDLRRFQYRITESPMPLEFHLGTVDVLPNGDGALVVYSTEVVPDDAKPLFDQGIASGVLGELGTDLGPVGQAWGALVARTWVAVVRRSLADIKAESERRALLGR